MGRWILCIAQCMGYIYKYVNAFSEQTYPIHSCRRSARTSCSGRGTSQSYRHKIRINYHARNRHNPHNSPGATTHPYIRGLKQHLYSCAGHLYRTSPPMTGRQMIRLLLIRRLGFCIQRAQLQSWSMKKRMVIHFAHLPKILDFLQKQRSRLRILKIWMRQLQSSLYPGRR